RIRQFSRHISKGFSGSDVSGVYKELKIKFRTILFKNSFVNIIFYLLVNTPSVILVTGSKELRKDQLGKRPLAYSNTRQSRTISSALIGLAMTLLMSTGAKAGPDQMASLQVPGIGKPSGNIDLVALETKISNTSAINIFDKLKLKNGIDSLTSEFDQFHSGQSANSLGDLKLRFEDFLHSTVAMLRKGDPSLAEELVRSREELWKFLTSPKAGWPSPTEP
ncbi:MAG: hypothetical protein O3C34_12725, partial [Proteobacteria bacterium]|nr:hypothetical protein [Pseudomonadota bacterium]